MSRYIRLVWDFFGETADGTAKHHLIHLEEFMTKEKIEYFNQGVDSKGELHALAFITVQETDVKILRDALKPHRAFVEKLKSPSE